MTDWSKPKDVDPIMMAFPTNVVGSLLPEWDDIPEEFRWTGDNPWCKAAQAWFFHGVAVTKSTIKPKDGVNAEKAVAHVGTCLGSFEPKHEHKIAGAGYLLSLFFDKFDPAPLGSSTD